MADIDTENLGNPGDVSIDELFLTLHDGTDIDILNFMVQFDLYEDIWNTHMHGSIVIADGQNLIEKAPIMGGEGVTFKIRNKTFASRNYPDFIIIRPYKIAIEYKKNSSGSIVKHGIGQCMMHTLGGEFDFVYCLIHDENKDKKILKSSSNEKERIIINKLWERYNVCMKFL